MEDMRNPTLKEGGINYFFPGIPILSVQSKISPIFIKTTTFLHVLYSRDILITVKAMEHRTYKLEIKNPITLRKLTAPKTNENSSTGHHKFLSLLMLFSFFRILHHYNF